MELEKALNGYAKALWERDIHVYGTNVCYDACTHCYVSAVAKDSKDAKFIDADDLIHFSKLMAQGMNIRPTRILSRGDFLLHPEIPKIIPALEEHANLEILSSGFPFTKRNPSRKELLQVFKKSNARFMVASPKEPYHSITKEDYIEAKNYIKSQGFNPNKFGYGSNNDFWTKAALFINPLAPLLLWLEKKSKDNKPLAIPIGRAANLPKENKRGGIRNCYEFENPKNLYLNYKGKLQYCIYSCHDGFMNISELKDIDNKHEAINYILEKLEKDITFNDMKEYNRCYFSKKIRKHSKA